MRRIAIAIVALCVSGAPAAGPRFETPPMPGMVGGVPAPAMAPVAPAVIRPAVPARASVPGVRIPIRVPALRGPGAKGPIVGPVFLAPGPRAPAPVTAPAVPVVIAPAVPVLHPIFVPRFDAAREVAPGVFIDQNLLTR